MEVRDGTGLCRFLSAMVVMVFFVLGNANAFGPDNETCLECHDGYSESLTGGPHQLGQQPGVSIKQVNCAACHDGGEVHVEDPSADNITSFRANTALEQAALCSKCHEIPHQSGMVGVDHASRYDLGCADCHQVHNNPNPHLNQEDVDNYCVTCHSEIMAEFKRRSSHPLEAGNVRCVDCHTLDAEGDPAQQIGLDWKCQSCHAETAGPFLYEHEVTGQHLIEGGGCTECHMPHGSPNERLLAQPGDALCNSCHGVPALHTVRHAGIATRFDCVDCHSTVHGSYDNNHYLDPMLGSKLGAPGLEDCGQSGCHTLQN